jgi:glucokinase
LPRRFYLGYGGFRLFVTFHLPAELRNLIEKFMILAGDIGGTKINLGLYDWDKGRVDPIREDSVWTADYESLEEVLTEFLEEPAPREPDSDETSEQIDDSSKKSSSTESPVTSACFGVPGPVLNNTCRTTNIPWTIEGDKLAEFLHIPQVRLYIFLRYVF